MITKYLPTFKVFEVGSLTGLRAGHMLSQQPAASTIRVKEVGDSKFIENGIIVGMNADGQIVNWSNAEGTDNVSKTMFVHYTEELNTFVDELKYFAVPVEEKYENGQKKPDYDSTYPRCIALYTGDSFCTDNVVGTPSAYAKVDNGVLTFVSNKADAQFAVKEGTLPTGDKAYDFVFLGA